MTRLDREQLAANRGISYKAKCHRDAILLLTLAGTQRPNDYPPARRTTRSWLKHARTLRLDAEHMGWSIP